MRKCSGCGGDLEDSHPSSRCVDCYHREEEKSAGYGKSAWRDKRPPHIHTYHHPKSKQGEFM